MRYDLYIYKMLLGAKGLTDRFAYLLGESGGGL